jgi:hypothetical protein
MRAVLGTEGIAERTKAFYINKEQHPPNAINVNTNSAFTCFGRYRSSVQGEQHYCGIPADDWPKPTEICKSFFIPQISVQLSTTEELLGRNSNGSGLESSEYGRRDVMLTTLHPSSAKVDTNFANKRRLLGWCIWHAYSCHGVLSFKI